MRFLVNKKTPTINHLYGHFRGRKFIKKEAKELRADIIDIINEQRKQLGFDIRDFQERQLKVRVEVHEDWYCKNGAVKRKDVSNREKFLIDTVFEALDLEDKFIWEHEMAKIQSDEEFFTVDVDVFNE